MMWRHARTVCLTVLIALAVVARGVPMVSAAPLGEHPTGPDQRLILMPCGGDRALALDVATGEIVALATGPQGPPDTHDCCEDCKLSKDAPAPDTAHRLAAASGRKGHRSVVDRPGAPQRPILGYVARGPPRRA